MRLMVYEGTPEEIRQVVDTLPKLSRAVSPPPEQSAAPEPPDADDTDEEPAEREFVSVKVARLMLSRRVLSKQQLQVLRAIYKAHPNKVAAPDLQNLTGYTPSQFAGLMGAFGRRLTHTPGYIEPTWFFDQEWDYENGHNLYGLPETVREAMHLEKLV